MTKSGKSSALSKPWPIGAWLMKSEPRRKRRIRICLLTSPLLRNDDISEMADALRQTVETLHQGPEQMDEFDEDLFNEMVEKITVDTDHVLRFRLRGGFDVAEPLWRETR